MKKHIRNSRRGDWREARTFLREFPGWISRLDGAKRCKTKVNGKEVILKSGNRLFVHMILVASSRKLNLKEVLKHPLGPIPRLLANTDGAPRKTNKAALVRKLGKSITR